MHHLLGHSLIGNCEVFLAPQWMFRDGAFPIAKWAVGCDCCSPQLAQRNAQIRHIEGVVDCRHRGAILLSLGSGDVYFVHKLILTLHNQNRLIISLQYKGRIIILKIITSARVLF